MYQYYAYLGNQVNIAGGNNNNKFYRGQVLVAGGRFYSWTRWGRVGESGQNSLEGPYGSADPAIDHFGKKFKDKTSYKWAGNTADYPGGKKDKYTVIFENFGGGQQQALAAAAAATGGPVTFAAPTIKGELADFTSFITDADMFKSQLATLGVDTAKMPLGDISQRTVDAGFKALLDIEAYLKAGGGPQLASLCSTFYTYIPHNFGRMKAPVLTLADIDAKKAMLNVIGDVGAAVSSESSSKAAAGGSTLPAPIDSKYASLGCTLKPLDPASEEFKFICAYTDNTQGHRKCQVDKVFEVERADSFGSHDKIGNRKLLWHGTNVAVVAAILKSGLRIMPHSGGRVGSGIYLASENGKSAGYVTAQGTKGIMFLCEAALGKQRYITRDGQVGHSEKDPVSAHGADSVLAIGSTEPDPAADITVKFDGKDVTVPQGTVKPNPLLAANGGSSSYSQSEYLVYKESQVRIRYVIQMKFQTPGGHWH